MNISRGYSIVALENTKSIENIGSTMRAAHCFYSSVVFVSGRRIKHHKTNTTKAHRHIPIIHVDDITSIIPYDCVPVGIEITDNAESLFDFVHPERAIYFFGAEDSGLTKNTLEKCARVVKIPTKFCLNLAGCVHVVLYDRMCKLSQ